eukprot:339145-Rhodomonas_salina.1
MSGTGTAYDCMHALGDVRYEDAILLLRHAGMLRDVRYCDGVCYAMCGTELGYGGTRRQGSCCSSM